MNLIISKTPLRISFFGGGTDFEEYYSKKNGVVISAAIDKYVYVVLKPWLSDAIRVSYSNGEIMENVDHIKHNLIREALKFLKIKGGLEISYLSDIPIGSNGTGLASSSALLVGILNALHSFKGDKVSAEQLALEAYTIERVILGHPGGKQDQYIAAYGGVNRFDFNADGTVSVVSLLNNQGILNSLKKNLMVFDTNIPTSSSLVSAEQKKNTPHNHQHLDNLVLLTNKAEKHLLRGDINNFGVCLNESWQIKKMLASKITSDEIDMIYEKAIKSGATGGKLLGAGGGGFLLLFVEQDKQDLVRKELYKYKEMNFDFEHNGSTIVIV